MNKEIIWHKHHIVPRHAGGTDDASNLIKVNIAMHAFLHEQRYKEFGTKKDLLAARLLKNKNHWSSEAIQLRSELGNEAHKANGWRHQKSIAKLGLEASRAAGYCVSKVTTPESLRLGGINAADARANDYIVTFPKEYNNLQIRVNNINKFARDMNLQGSHLKAVARGTRRHNKGFTAMRISNV